MQFYLLEKPTSANYFQVEREKSYDYILIIYLTKLQIQSKFRCSQKNCTAVSQSESSNFVMYIFPAKPEESSRFASVGCYSDEYV